MEKSRIELSNSRNSEAITAATRELIKEKGYRQVSVQDICKRSGVSRSSFYSVFSGKDDVLLHMIRSLKEDSERILAHFVTARSDLERIWRLYDTYLNVALEFGPDIMASFLSVDAQSNIGFLQQFYLYNDWFKTLVKSCQRQGIILNTGPAGELVDAAVYSAFGTVLEWCRQKGGFDLRQRSFSAHEAIYNIHPDYRGIWRDMEVKADGENN